MLIGNKSDLVLTSPASRQVSSELVDSFCKQHHLEYFETSAKSGANVRESLDLLLMKIFEMGSRNPGNKPFEGVALDQNNSLAKKEAAQEAGGCC